MRSRPRSAAGAEGVVRRNCREPSEAQEMLRWDQGGGFSIDASVPIEARGRADLARLLRYCARPPFANDGLKWDDGAQQTVLYHLPKPAPDGRLAGKLEPLELIDKLAALIPPPKHHCHRYHRVPVPNALWRKPIAADANDEAHLAESAPTSIFPPLRYASPPARYRGTTTSQPTAHYAPHY